MKILFLSPWFPYPPVNGSKIRIYNLLKSLGSCHSIELISFVRDGEQVDPRGIIDFCSSIQTINWVEFQPKRLKALSGFLADLPRSVYDTYSREMGIAVLQSIQTRTPDLVIASQLGTAPYAQKIRRAPTILEEIEIGSIWESWAKADTTLSRIRHGLTWFKTRRYINNLLQQFTACTVVSSYEKSILDQTLPDKRNIHVLPNGVDLEQFQPDSEQPVANTLIYNGALTYSANFDAMKFFLEQISSQVKAQIPDVSLSITGSHHGVDLSGLSIDKTVKLTGFLPDIRPAVASAWACVVPLRLGGGTRLKILEAMALGTPVISTNKGAEGLEVTPEKNILIADDPAEFARHTIRLMQDSDLRSRLSISGRKLVEAKYGWDEIGDQFLQLVENTAQK
jgi:glycosyltransferase involved in cell wall biosynthesis